MCGIAGIIHNGKINYQSTIELMNKAQTHRGPDDNGLKQFKNAVLGHTRLSIVDISIAKTSNFKCVFSSSTIYKRVKVIFSNVIGKNGCDELIVRKDDKICGYLHVSLLLTRT